MTITIVLSTFNGEAFLAEQLGSFAAQTATDWTLLVRDDGSSDGTVGILQAAAEQLPVVFSPSSGQHLGPAASFLTLTGEVETDYFALADQDDVWLPAKLEASLAALRQVEVTGRPCAVFSDAVMTDASGQTVRDSALAHRFVRHPERLTYGELLMQNVAIGATIVGNRTAAQMAGEFAGQPVPMHDWLVAALAKARGELRFCGDVGLRQRQHDANATNPRRSAVERARSILVGGPSGWRARCLEPAVSLARCLSAGDLSDPKVELLATVDPTDVSVQVVWELESNGLRLPSPVRQAILTGRYGQAVRELARPTKA